MELYKEITLTFERKYFEEIYYASDRGHYIKGPSIKGRVKYVSIAFSALIMMVVYYVNGGELGYLILVLVVLFFLILNYFDQFYVLKKWKKEINDFLDYQDKYKSHKLLLNDNYFALEQDEIKSIEKWTNINRVKVYENFIQIECKENYMFPKKSMQAAEFEFFKELISEKVK